jgi:ABC-type glycerol-3-phosphate transport system substrate-binding protein
MTSLKRMTRRDFLRGAAVTGVGLGLAACVPPTAAPPAAQAPAAEATSAAPAAGEKKVIEVTGIPGPTADQLKFHADAFMKQNPNVEIVLNIAGGAETEYKPNFPQIAMSADRPDVAWYWVDGRQYQDLVEAGALEPLDDLYEREGWDKVMPPSTLQKYTSPDGHRYAVNWTIVWYPQIYYNKKIFEEVGVELPADGVAYKTVDEWYGVCDKIRAAGYEPVTIGSKEGWRIGHCHDVLLQRIIPEEMFVDYFDNWRPGAEPKIRYTDPLWLEADKMLKEWFDKGVFAEGDLGRNYAEGRAVFDQGKAAMYQDGSWAVGILRDEAPDIDFGWMLYPQVKEEIPAKFLLYAGNGLMIPKNPSDLEIAKEFVAFCLSKERQTALAEEPTLTEVPSRIDIPDEAMAQMDPVAFDMWKLLPTVGTATGWDDPVPADLAERSFILFQEMLTGAREPETVGEDLEKLAERHRQKA